MRTNTMSNLTSWIGGSWIRGCVLGRVSTNMRYHTLLMDPHYSDAAKLYEQAIKMPEGQTKRETLEAAKQSIQCTMRVLELLHVTDQGRQNEMDNSKRK